MHERKLLPPGFRHVQNGETLSTLDRALYLRADGNHVHSPIRAELIGDIYDSDWHEHPGYVVRHDDVIEPPDPGLLAEYHRRYADYLEEGVPVDPRDQALLDAGAVLEFRLNALRRERARRAA